jgi:ribonucleoside-diphosphate reductase alpha chain
MTALMVFMILFANLVQQNLGTIKSSNLCTEIMEYTDANEIAVCNLASLALPRYIINGEFDHQKLYEVTYQATIVSSLKIK